VTQHFGGIRHFLVLVSVVSAVASCAPPNRVAVELPTFPPACTAGTGVSWVSLDNDTHRSTLDGWCRSVGAPHVATVPAEASGDIRRLMVLSWNVHVGGGEVPELVASVRRTLEESGRRDTGIVLLLQEMFRAGDVVPARLAGMFDIPARIAPKRQTPEIRALARELGMSAAYVPSMRNGDSLVAAEREDRGSAILSTEPLSDVTAIELPMLKQRRVVVMATVSPRGSHVAPVRVMATHLDTLGPRGAQAKALAKFIAQLPPEPRLVMGGDLNALWGVSDQTVRTLSSVMSMERCGDRRTHLFGRFDYIFTTLGASVARTCTTLEDKYSSDHRPLLLTLY
jgi:endonuclease/exonuclease/phosphatase family metal-dependent hydrolase